MRIKITLTSLTIVLVFFGCQDTTTFKHTKKNTIGKETDTCFSLVNHLELINYQDPKGEYKIQLPKNWWLEETLVLNNYGVTVVDSTLSPSEGWGIAISTLKNTMPLKEYINNEINKIEKDNNVRILDTGEQIINKEKFYWIKCEYDDELKTTSYLNYFNNNDKNRVYIVNSFANGLKNINYRICQLQSLIKTFELKE